ncbi:hypothetical protein [Sciscionella sediminilitoris]|uniref:hypothetical protein n=1 Tax=Sciscionella sediminilitoris TaxID=1445613 RepID=UPI0004DF08AE|nr:hypothetical protein [Sciscionella sp. SE31]
MPWFKVDDSFYDHPKVFDAPDSAVALWTRAGSWSARNLTDGFVPANLPARLCDTPETAVQALLDRGLWRRTKGGYRFHEWDSYQPTAAQVKDLRAKRAEAGRRGGRAKAHNTKQTADNGQASASGDAKQNATPTRPVPEKEEDSLRSSSKKATRGTRIPDDFAATPEMVTWAREHTPHVDGRTETAKFIDYWQAKTGKDATKLDWVATWRNWMRNAAERAPNRGRKPTKDDKIRALQALKSTPLPALEGGAS